MTNHNNKNYLRYGAGIFIAATAGFLFIAALGAYWAMDIMKNSSPSAPVDVPQVVAKQTVKVYFSNSNLNKEMMDCGLVYPVDREIDKTPAVARATLMELLAGTTTPEENGGYFSSINPGVKIKSLNIVDGAATVDFDKKMDEGMGGSCRVSAVRSQITKTLMQFPTVKSVVISVEGNSEEALQP